MNISNARNGGPKLAEGAQFMSALPNPSKDVDSESKKEEKRRLRQEMFRRINTEPPNPDDFRSTVSKTSGNEDKGEILKGDKFWDWFLRMDKEYLDIVPVWKTCHNIFIMDGWIDAERAERLEKLLKRDKEKINGQQKISA